MYTLDSKENFKNELISMMGKVDERIANGSGKIDAQSQNASKSQTNDMNVLKLNGSLTNPVFETEP